MHYRNALEPAGLLQHFLDHPPLDFRAECLASGAPVFTARFDLLTTADESAQRLFARIPGGRFLRRLLCWPTMFYGTTVSEYAPLPPQSSAQALCNEVFTAWKRSTRLMILKDIPTQSALLGAEDNGSAEALVAECHARDFILVEGQALAWLPIDFADEDEYLSRLSSGRRRDIRRKLRVRSEMQIEILETGDVRFRDEAFLAEMYAMYREVYAQSEIHFDLLSADFFRALLQDAGLCGQVFFYRRADELVGYNICFVHEGKLIDKYIGLRYPAARECNLYFVSWMENLAYARRLGLTHYVAGWTDPQIKAYLGARFTFTRHAVYVRNPILRAILRRLSSHFESDREVFENMQHGPAADS